VAHRIEAGSPESEAEKPKRRRKKSGAEQPEADVDGGQPEGSGGGMDVEGRIRMIRAAFHRKMLKR
jgi:hypothetical protein